ncbi:protein SFI1 [Microdochium nivale]|nr:protein SFI1 [Microdochium nivale]
MALAPSTIEDSIASSDLDFSDVSSDISSSHTSPTNRTFDEAHHDPPALGPLAQPMAPWDEGSSMIDHEFSDLDIQTLFAVVQRAQDVLPTLPPINRRPVPALFEAYYEILPQRGIDPDDDQQIAKLIFKLGGVKTGGSLEEKFTAVMSRMGIELHLDDLQSHVSDDTERDDAEGDDAPMPDLPALEQIRSRTPYKAHYDPQHVRDDTMTTDYTDGGLSAITEESLTQPVTEDIQGQVVDSEDENAAASERDLSERDLQETALTFHDEHKFVFPVTTAFQRWYNKAAFASHILAQFSLARQADLEDDAQHKFQEWRSVAIEAHEVAARAHEIYALKSSLNRWRQRTRTASHRGALADTNQCDPMQRIATKAHNNLMLSRAFTRWYNRTKDEVSRERLAQHAYETSLKAKIFDTKRTQPPAVSQSARGSTARKHDDEEAQIPGPSSSPPKGQTETSTANIVPVKTFENSSKEREPVEKPSVEPKFGSKVEGDHAKSAANPSDGPEARVKREKERQRAEERRSALKARTLSLIRALSERNQKDEETPGGSEEADLVKTEPDDDAEADNATQITAVLLEDELDERTLIARRHILRMRYFSAWEDYTQHHLSLVNEFEQHKMLDSWRRQSRKIPDQLQQAQERGPESRRRATRKWLRRVRTHEQLDERAEWVCKKSRLSQTLAQWLVSSRQKQRSTLLKRRALSAWYDQPNADTTLAACADKFHKFHQSASTFNAWRQAAAREFIATGKLNEYGRRAGYYYAATGVLRAWKAVSKETSRKALAKKRALDRWRDDQHREIKAQGVLQEYADRALFYSSIVKVLPKWRARAKEIAGTRHEQSSYCPKANYYYSTKGALDGWRTRAKQQRKQRLRDAHLETRRLVKKGAGQRAVYTWYQQLAPQMQRASAMDEALNTVLEDRTWRQNMQAMQVWRGKALQKQGIIDEREAAAKQKAMIQWQQLAEDNQELVYGAQAHWENTACTKALKRWNLRRDQNASRPLMVAYALEKKDRRMVRHGLERWYSRTAEQQLSLDAVDGQESVAPLKVATFEEAITSAKGKSPARGGTQWTASLGPAGRSEDIYVPTPGRPSLMLGDFGIRDMLTTTPLGPVPRRSWHPDTQESSMRGSAFGGRASRARKNLRVSFAR